MHRPTILTAALLAAALVPAVPAAAKEVVGVSVCGATGCVDRSDQIGPQRPDSGLLDIGNVRIAEPDRAPYVRVKLAIGDGQSKRAFGHNTMLFLPKPGIAATEDGSWWMVPPRSAAVLRRLAHGVPRLPARTLHALRPPAEATAPPARVSDVVLPPKPAPAARTDDGVSPAVPAAIAAAVVALGTGLLLLRRRRHHDPGETPATT
jgi:hypothetical protein